MFTLRCTSKLLSRMKLTPDDFASDPLVEPTTALGDWYAHLVHVDRQQLVVLVSDVSRLCVVTTAKDIGKLKERFEAELFATLGLRDLEPAALEKEREQMREFRLGSTTAIKSGKSILGTINRNVQDLRFLGVDRYSNRGWPIFFLKCLLPRAEPRRTGDEAAFHLKSALDGYPSPLGGNPSTGA